jgi:uncharacterized membrane-anchored protein
MKKLITLATVVVVQAALVGAAVAPQLSARLTGDTYYFRVAPLDPIDPFRGAYVTLNYPDLRPDPVIEPGLAFPEDTSGPLFVRLREEGGVWVAADTTRTRPDQGPYLTCHEYLTQCGIESLFLPQDEAAAMEELLRDGAIAEVKIDGRGHAALIDVRAP